MSTPQAISRRDFLYLAAVNVGGFILAAYAVVRVWRNDRNLRLRYVNPSTFGIQKLAEVLAMVYFGGLNSVYGSIVGACSISLLGEMLRPLEQWKWIIIPLLLILVMIFRPTGLIAFKEFDVRKLVQPKKPN